MIFDCGGAVNVSGVTPCNMFVTDGCICCMQEGLTPLHLAALYGSEEIVRILVLEFQLNPNVADYVSPLSL